MVASSGSLTRFSAASAPKPLSLIWAETPTNPAMRITDIAGMAELFVLAESLGGVESLEDFRVGHAPAFLSRRSLLLFSQDVFYLMT